MRRYLLILCNCLLLLTTNLFGQAIDNKMVQYSLNYDFEAGIYLSFEEFKNNNPGIKDNVKSEGNSVMLFHDSTKKYRSVNPDSVWGYSSENNVYVAVEGSFWKLINIGQLSQFTAVVITQYQTIDAFGFPVDRYTRTLSQLFIDFSTGELKRLNKQNLEVYLDQNSVLAAKLKKRLKNEMGLIIALKAYNELYPIYFPRP